MKRLEDELFVFVKETYQIENQEENDDEEWRDEKIREKLKIADIQLIFDYHKIFPLLEKRGSYIRNNK